MSKHPSRVSLDASSAGAEWDGTGATFSLLSRTASRVELCLFDASGERRVDMARSQPARWSVHVESAAPGLEYGFRVHGPWEPSRGLFHNPAKLLLDPYARAVRERLTFHPSQTCALATDGTEQLSPDPRDSAQAGLRSVLIDERFDWRDDRAPKIAWRDTVIYECHVKGMTARHPGLPVELRGRYLGLCAEPIVKHLRDLGVTTLSLMPIAASYTERRLLDAGLVNYWGYQPIAYFAPTPAYASAAGREVHELKTLICELHRAGIEVLLDIVLNHTGEGPSVGPSAGPLLGLRGIDPGYFRRDADQRWRDQDYTGCGNTLDLRDPLCLTLALDCLRYWARAFHVDGFRLDLAPVLFRRDPDFSASAPLLSAIQQDPLLSALKWVAEPWDLGPDGYCLGRFPAPIREWNDRFREAARRFARGDIGARNELATRLAGSADVFGVERTATSSINYIVSHDGLTLRDLVSYARKHNHGNGEDNRDGRDDNSSSCWGVEGESEDPVVHETRRRVASAMMVMLACAQGTPMLSHGDELGRTQRGNNNAYCQDSAQTHVDWEPAAFGASMHQLTRALFSLRAQCPALRMEPHCHGELTALGLPNLSWLGRDGRALDADDWRQHHDLTLGMLRCHVMPDAVDGSSADIVLALWNMSAADTSMRLPTIPISGAWTVRIDTAPDALVPRVQPHDHVMLLARCAMVFTWELRA